MAKRRNNNDGSIYMRKDGLWCAQVSLQGRRLTKYARTQSECRAWIKEMVSRIKDGLTFEGTQTTLERFVAGWLKAKVLSRRPKTVLQYRQIVKLHILPTMGQMKLQDIQPAHLRQLYDMKREEGRGARTIQLIHVTLHNMLKQAVREGILSRNPADVVERPKVEQREMQILISDQIQRFLDAASGSRFETFYFLALSTGMREGELLGLKWSDINWKESKLFVQRELQLINGQGLIFLPPKTKAGVRMIQIGASTLRKLDEHRGQQEIQKSIAGERWQENDLLFTTKIGKPVDCNQVIKEFKHILKVAGLPNIRVHDLRHTSLSSLMNMGTPVNTVQRRAGHADPSTTVKVYGHATSQTQKKAAQKIESLIVSTIAKLR